MLNKQILLARRPTGMVKEGDFEMAEKPTEQLAEGQFLVKNHYISLDPAIRGWMNAGTTYMPGSPLGEPMRAFAAGEVVESKHPGFRVGQFVQGLLGCQQYALTNGQGIDVCNTEYGTLSWHLGVLGMPGMTAYFGLLEKGQPQAGETVFVSGAAGIVGSMVGQLAKIKGCKVIGSAGGKDKCDYLLSIGFDAVIDYKTQDIATQLKVIAPNGIHVFYDNIGGDTLDAALANLGRGARVVICGAISQYNNDGGAPLGPKNYMKIVTARGYMTGIIVFDYYHQYPQAIAEIAQWLKEGKIQYREHVVEGIENFAKALLMLYNGENFGKLVLKIV